MNCYDSKHLNHIYCVVGIVLSALSKFTYSSQQPYEVGTTIHPVLTHEETCRSNSATVHS